jgi:hypothetical protein
MDHEYMGLLPVIGVVRIANHFIYTRTWVYFRLLVWSVLLVILFIRIHGFTSGYWGVNPCTRINKMISNMDHTNNRE